MLFLSISLLHTFVRVVLCQITKFSPELWKLLVLQVITLVSGQRLTKLAYDSMWKILIVYFYIILDL